MRKRFSSFFSISVLFFFFEILNRRYIKLKKSKSISSNEWIENESKIKKHIYTSRKLQWNRWWADLFAMNFGSFFFFGCCCSGSFLYFISLSFARCCLLLYFRLYVVFVRHEIQYTWIHLIQKVKNLYKYSQRWFMMFAPATHSSHSASLMLSENVQQEKKKKMKTHT